MLVGAIIGLVFGEKVMWLKPIGDIFLRLLIMAAIPLVIFNLLAGISSLGDFKSFGKIGIKVVTWYLVTTTFAMALGIAIMYLFGAGYGMTLKGDVPSQLGETPSVIGIILDMIPDNIFASLAQGNLIHVVVFTTVLGFATLALNEEKKAALTRGYDILADLMRSLVEIILKMSPLGMGALMAATMAEYGTQIVGPLSIFIVAVYVGQLAMVFLYMILLSTLGGVKPIWFLQQTKDLYATTIATCSSLASLVVSFEVAEMKLKLPKKIFSFTLPLGAQFNKDGTSIMLSGILVFTAQAAGIDLSFGEMAQIVFVGLIISEGSSGIPGGGLVIAMLFAEAFSLPLEIVAIVGGIYRLIDMGNTTINCMGDMVITTIVSKSDADWKPDYSSS